jgi:hypothetical protein
MLSATTLSWVVTGVAVLVVVVIIGVKIKNRYY